MRLLMLMAGLAMAPAPQALAQAGLPEALLAFECTDDPGVTTCIATAGHAPEAAVALTAVVVVASADAFHADVVPVDRAADVAGVFAAECPESPASIIGGYFGRTDAGDPYPLGLVVSQSTPLSRWTPWRVGGAILVDPALRTTIRYWHEIDAEAGLDVVEALQSKPILVDANANDGIGAGWERWNRVAFGLTGEGDLALIGVFTPSGTGMLRGPRLGDFADFIARIRLPDGRRIARAINLDGGTSANLYLRGTDRLFGVRGERYVPNIVCLAAR